MKAKNSVNGDETFLRSAWDYWDELERDQEVDITFEVVPQKRSGVWLIYLVACDMQSGIGFMRPIARYRVEYPNSQNVSLAGAWFNAVLALDKLVSDVRGRFNEAPQK